MKPQENREKARRGLLARFPRKDREGRALAEKIPFDPARQIPVLRSSICTGKRSPGSRTWRGAVLPRSC